STQRVIIFQGAGKAFCAGLDMEEASKKDLTKPSGEGVAKLLRTVATCPLVTIAAVNGPAVAGGAGLVAACDLAVASTEATISFPEVRRGLVPGLVMTFLLRQLGRKQLHELLLLGEPVDAKTAQNMGLINKTGASQ